VLFSEKVSTNHLKKNIGGILNKFLMRQAPKTPARKLSGLLYYLIWTPMS
jgi:hypothetical protein